MNRAPLPPPPDIPIPVAPGLSLVVEDGMKRWRARQAGIVIAVGMLVLALLNAQGLYTWSSKLPANALSEAMFGVSQFWLDLMDRLGLTDAMTALRKAFESLRNL